MSENFQLQNLGTQKFPKIYYMLKGGTTLIAQLSWVIYLTLPLTRDRPARSYVAYPASHGRK